MFLFCEFIYVLPIKYVELWLSRKHLKVGIDSTNKLLESEFWGSNYNDEIQEEIKLITA